MISDDPSRLVYYQRLLSMSGKVFPRLFPQLGPLRGATGASSSSDVIRCTGSKLTHAAFGARSPAPAKHPHVTYVWAGPRNARIPDFGSDVVHRRSARSRLRLGQIDDRRFCQHSARRLRRLQEDPLRALRDRAVEQLDHLEHRELA